MRPYRPECDTEHDPDCENWEDNQVSNTLAYLSHRFVPRWCETPDHWTSKLANYFWADCGCCLFFRGILLGFILGSLATIAITTII